MDPRDAIRARITDLRRELDRLEAAVWLLDGEPSDASAESPAVTLPRICEQIVADLVRDAGADGATAAELHLRLSAVCDSPVTSVRTMLTRLRQAGVIRNAGGRWFGV